MTTLEKRAVQELRFDDSSGVPKIIGYASVFNSRSVDLGGFVEVVHRDAFNNTLSDNSDIRALVDHDSSKIIGRQSNGTLDITTDNHGLRVTITPPETSVGMDVVELLKRGDLDAASFGFVVNRDSWDTDGDGVDVRTLHDVELREVSIVAFPAYPDTSMAVRSHDGWKDDCSESVNDDREQARLANATRRAKLSLVEWEYKSTHTLLVRKKK